MAIFLATNPGIEAVLAEEARALGFADPHAVPGGVDIRGTWPDVWRANLALRCASRVTARFAEFRALHLAQLDKRARRVPWADVLRRDVPFRVEATCRVSRIYHSGAAAERVERAIIEELGAPLSPDAQVVVRVRIEDDLCTLSVDTSGELLHKRGFKVAVAKAPLRETLAAAFLRMCEFDGRETILDPMCGSGTFVIEAAEIARGLLPGRERSYAFESLASFHSQDYADLRAAAMAQAARGLSANDQTAIRFHGFDRDAGAIRMSLENAARAGVDSLTAFEACDIAELQPPPGPPGLVVVNPPYGERIGDKGDVAGLYRTLGRTLTARFAGWRVGLVTNDSGLARATGLPFGPASAPVSNGGLRVSLYRTPKLR